MKPSPNNPFAEDGSDSEDSLAPDAEDQNEPFPPLPSDIAIVKTEPEPEKGHIEPSRTPSPVKMKNAQPGPVTAVPVTVTSGPPSYEEVTDFPAGYLNTVIAVYPYKAADEDELSFNKGENIYVIKHPQPDEQVSHYSLDLDSELNDIFRTKDGY